MLEQMHRLGSVVRHSTLLDRQQWMWNLVEPAWKWTFSQLAEAQGFATRMNDDEFRLTYE